MGASAQDLEDLMKQLTQLVSIYIFNIFRSISFKL